MNVKENRYKLYQRILLHLLAGLLAIAMAITPVYAAIQENTSQYDPSSWVTNRQGPSDQRFNEFVSITVGPITEDNVTINVSAPNYTRNQSGAVRKTYWSTAIQYSVDGGPWYSTDPYHKDGSLAWAGYDKAVSASVTIPRTGAARRVAVRSLILRYVFEDMASQTRKTYMYYYNHPRSVLIPAKGFYAATQTFQSSGVWTAPADGNYQFHVIGRGGDGTGGNSGHGGGGGGYAVHQAYMKKGETANIIISAAQSALSVKGQTVIANAGATGGAGGTASGGNISNQAGTAGQGGIRIIYGYDSDDSAEYEYMGGYGGAAQGAYGGAGGSFSWAGTGQNGLQYGDGGGGCARTSLWGGGTGSAGIGAAGAVIIEAPTDRVPPAILGVNTPSYWVPGAMATISAQDDKSGIVGYAVTKDQNIPSNWQASNQCTIEPGLQYAWAIDALGNISAPFAFTVAVDTDAPVIQDVTVDTVFSDGPTRSDIMIKAEDPVINGSIATGVRWYAVTQTSNPPAQGDWQGDNVFSIEGQGDWYAWAKDVVGNVSEPFPFAPDVDSDAPVIHSVTVDTTFSDGLTYSDVTIEAEDPIIDGDAASGVKWYAITQSIVSPSQGDWQEANVFSIEGQGDWYAWAKDVMGNVSKPFPFAPDVDSDAPVIHDVVVDTVFTDGLICSDVIIDAEDPVINGDAASGVRWYAITKSSVFPTEGDWQEANVFSIEGQGDWYAWAKDVMGNVSKPYFITITAPPEYSTKDAAAVVTDPDGKPAEGCIVEIVNGNGTIIGAGETDINGYTKIPEVPVGEYELVIRDSDGSVLGTGSTVVTPDGISGSMTEGDHSVSVFPAEEYITQIITGSVTDQKGNPAIGYIVEIVNRNDRVVGSDLTDRYGYFEIPGIPVGDYSIVIRDPDGNIIGVGSITVGPDQVSGGLTEGNCTITVPANYITQDVVGTIKDHEGNPAIDYLVELIDKYDRVAGSDCTDKNGYFEILGIPVGEYTMVVRDPNGNIVGTGYVSVTPEGVSGELTEGLYTAAISFLAKNQLEEETDKSVYWELALKEVKEKALTGKKSIRLGYLPNYQLPVWWLEELRETGLDVELSFYALNYAKNSAVLWSFHTKDLGSFPASRISYDLETSDDKVSPIVPEGEIVLRQLQVKHLEELPFPFAMEVTTSWLRGKEANLYSFDSQNQTLTLIDTGVIDEERKVKFHLQKGGDYIITVKNN